MIIRNAKKNDFDELHKNGTVIENSILPLDRFVQMRTLLSVRVGSTQLFMFHVVFLFREMQQVVDSLKCHELCSRSYSKNDDFDVRELNSSLKLQGDNELHYQLINYCGLTTIGKLFNV